jgi:hypothetical protein
VASRRKRAESRAKDLEQALYVAPIVKSATLKRVYQELPKTWQRIVIRTLERAIQSTILLRREAQELLGTLQEVTRD